ncbi:hypothetical protein IGI04_019752, partial [Brassica rapa subsp. trilocularis]
FTVSHILSFWDSLNVKKNEFISRWQYRLFWLKLISKVWTMQQQRFTLCRYHRRDQKEITCVNWKTKHTHVAGFIWVLQDNGWSSVACTGCSRKLDRSDTFRWCNRFSSPNVTGMDVNMGYPGPFRPCPIRHCPFRSV